MMLSHRFHRTAIAALLTGLTLLVSFGAGAHHVLGRPAYQLNEDSNTPPSIQGEAQVGDFSTTYMVYPAFPRPHEPGRISFYATNAKTGEAHDGEVVFSIRQRHWYDWLGLDLEYVELGTQKIDDKVYRQAFQFEQAGDYMISIQFIGAGEKHTLDFPLTVGHPPGVDFTSVLIGIVLLLFVAAVMIVHRRRAMTGHLRAARNESKDAAE